MHSSIATVTCPVVNYLQRVVVVNGPRIGKFVRGQARQPNSNSSGGELNRLARAIQEWQVPWTRCRGEDITRRRLKVR